MAEWTGYWLSQGQYAKHRGVSQPAIAKLIKQGKLDGAFEKVGGRYQINPERADAILAAFHNPARSKTPKSPMVTSILQGAHLGDLGAAGPPSTINGNQVSFAEAARREKIAKAAILELDLKKRRGELIERDRVEAVAAKLGTLVRVGMEAIPTKVAPTIAALETPGDVARYLQREIKTVLSDMAKGIAELEL